MGLLDDAIREHLDLKRRRGADPTEIERAEREALGPVRRNRGPDAPDDAEPVAADAAEPTGEVSEGAIEPDEGPPTGELTEPPIVDDEPYDDEPYEDEEPGDDEPQDDGPRHVEEPSHDDEPFAEDDPSEPEPATRVMRLADIPAPGDATAEYDVEEAFAAEAESETGTEDEADEDPNAGDAGDEHGPEGRDAATDEDMLEETPEFLQDTPDHDRLWFEQRPPRDFDFDG